VMLEVKAKKRLALLRFDSIQFEFLRVPNGHIVVAAP